MSDTTTDEDIKFKRWKRVVDAYIIAKCGLTSEDIDDWDYRMAFDCGYTPKDAAMEALEEAGYDTE